MTLKRIIPALVIAPLLVCNLAAASDVADAVMKKDWQAVRALLQKKADVNAAQVDGSTALLWAVHWDNTEIADLLIRAGADVKAAARTGGTPMEQRGWRRQVTDLLTTTAYSAAKRNVFKC